MGMDAVKPGRLAQTVADHLERLILEGTLRPGERLLAERDLAAKLDISRPSLRDALFEIAKAEERLDQSLRRLAGGGLTSPPPKAGS